MARIRTFIAVDLGEQLRARLVAMQETLARVGTDVKWVEPENLHVTLLFLGEVDERELPDVCKAVSGACAKFDAFTLGIAAIGCFPNPRRPRTIWAGVGEGEAELIALHDALEEPLLELGCYRREARPFTPHVTLGRVKIDPTDDSFAVALPRHANWKAGDIEVREVRVMSSELRSDGPIYAVLSRGRLRQGRRPVG